MCLAWRFFLLRNPFSLAQVQRLFVLCARQRLGNLSTFLCGHYRGRVEVKMEIFDLAGLDREPRCHRNSGDRRNDGRVVPEDAYIVAVCDHLLDVDLFFSCMNISAAFMNASASVNDCSGPMKLPSSTSIARIATRSFLCRASK